VLFYVGDIYFQINEISTICLFN